KVEAMAQKVAPAISKRRAAREAGRRHTATAATTSPTTTPLVEKMKVRSRLIRQRCSAATARQELPIGLVVPALAVAVAVRTVLPRLALSGAGGLALSGAGGS